jgi:hypothetical protein
MGKKGKEGGKKEGQARANLPERGNRVIINLFRFGWYEFNVFSWQLKGGTA